MSGTGAKRGTSVLHPSATSYVRLNPSLLSAPPLLGEGAARLNDISTVVTKQAERMQNQRLSYALIKIMIIIIII